MPISKASSSAVAPAAKGDLVVGSATNDAAVLGVGSNDQVLTADSSTATGLKWATAGGSLTLSQIATGTLSGASVTFSSLSTYDTLVLRIANTTNNTANGQFICRINNNSGSNYQTTGWKVESLTNIQSQFGSQTSLYGVFDSYINNNSNNSFIFYFTNCKNAGFTYYHGTGAARGGSDYILTSTYQGVYTIAEAVSSLVVSNTGGNFNAGSYTLWGG